MNIYEKRLQVLAQTIFFIKKIYLPEKLTEWVDVKTNRIGLPQFLWRFRVSLNLSEDEFAKSLALTPEEYEKYECIGSSIPDSLIKKILEKYRIDITNLYSGKI